jgi:hypothetical protein
MTVWLVHECDDNDYYVFKHDLVGVYSSEEKARMASECHNLKGRKRRMKAEWKANRLEVDAGCWYEVESHVLDA